MHSTIDFPIFGYAGIMYQDIFKNAVTTKMYYISTRNSKNSVKQRNLAKGLDSLNKNDSDT